MKLLKFLYNSLFYTLYKWNEKIQFKWKTSVNILVVKTILGLVFFEVALLSLLIAFSEDYVTISSPFSSLFSALLTVANLYFLHWVFYERNENYHKIISDYESVEESKISQLIRNTITILLIGGTLFLFISYHRLFE